jgi:hypothetical protein
MRPKALQACWIDLAALIPLLTEPQRLCVWQLLKRAGVILPGAQRSCSSFFKEKILNRIGLLGGLFVRS